MMPPIVRVAYVTDPAEARERAAPPLAGAKDLRALPARQQVPVQLLGAIGERLAASAVQVMDLAALPSGQATGTAGELARLERFGLQLQELAQVAARAQQLRHESVDLGLALLQTVAEWSAEADRLGVELHGPACSEQVHANPAALKHVLDLMVEHALQQGRAVRLEIEPAATGPGARLVVSVSSEPASQCPQRDTLAWTLLQWFAAALGLVPQRQAVPRGERLTLTWPRP